MPLACCSMVRSMDSGHLAGTHRHSLCQPWLMTASIAQPASGLGLSLNTAHCLNTAGAAAVKPAAARGLASLLRACRRERQRTDLYCRIMQELAWGRSCFARLAFIQVWLRVIT